MTDLLLRAVVCLSINLAKFSAERVQRRSQGLRRSLDGIATTNLMAAAVEVPATASGGEQQLEALRSLLVDLSVMLAAMDAAAESANEVTARLTAAGNDLQPQVVALQQEPTVLDQACRNVVQIDDRAAPERFPSAGCRAAGSSPRVTDLTTAANDIAAASRRFQVIVTIIEELASRSGILASSAALPLPPANHSASNATHDVQLTMRSADSMSRTARQASEISDLMARIAVVSREQACSMRELSAAMLQVAAITRRYRSETLLDQCAGVVEMLEQQTSALRSTLAGFEAAARFAPD